MCQRWKLNGLLKVSLNAEGVVMGVHGHDVMSKESDTDPGGP